MEDEEAERTVREKAESPCLQNLLARYRDLYALTLFLGFDRRESFG